MSVVGKHLQALNRRADHLARRVAEARSKGKNPTFDVTELHALNWALRVLSAQLLHPLPSVDKHEADHS